MTTCVSERRKPGRPKESSKYNRTGTDNATLHQVAEIISANPGISVSSAIKQVIGVGDTAGLRRLQDKYRTKGQALQREGDERRQVKAQESLKSLVKFAENLSFVVNIGHHAFTGWLGTPQGKALMADLSKFDAAMKTFEQSPKIKELVLKINSLGKVNFLTAFSAPPLDVPLADTGSE